MHAVFVDSDVVISSLISKSGAAYLLLHCNLVSPVISSISLKELETVRKRLNIEKYHLDRLKKERLKIVKLKESVNRIKKCYQDYTFDINDSHIIAGAHKAQIRFLISYNIQHFQVEKIKKDFGIITLSPGHFLQYLRSLK
ncbi:PIN domain-containing protein [Candidatus Gottesmanbacteria bacterium]|nr:PIN domain-containing protein [Candidatus Gottesmanbacteria bacterium]